MVDPSGGGPGGGGGGRLRPVAGGGGADAFFRVVRAGFSQRRKQLRNTLAAGLRLPPDEVAAKLKAADVDPRRRAQTLSLEEWGRVARALGDSD